MRLALPAPVYRVRSADGTTRYLMPEGVDAEKAWDRIEEVAFFAVPPARAPAGLLPVFSATADVPFVLQTGKAIREARGAGPLFLALAATDDLPATVALYEYQSADGQRTYSTEPDRKDPELKRTLEPLCRVWKNPSSVLVLDWKARPIAQREGQFE